MPDVPSEADVQKIVSGASPYSPSNKPKLEAYLRAQATGGAPYNFDANRILIKLYQFFPCVTGEDKDKERTNTALALTLALLQYPNTTDFLALACLVPDRLKSQEPGASIVKCADLLDDCRFAEFWALWKTLESNTPSSIAAVPLAQHHAKLQTAICGVLALTYRTAPLKLVLAACDNADLGSMKAFVEKTDASSVYFVATADNTKRNRVFQDVDFNSISTLMAKIAKE